MYLWKNIEKWNEIWELWYEKYEMLCNVMYEKNEMNVNARHYELWEMNGNVWQKWNIWELWWKWNECEGMVL